MVSFNSMTIGTDVVAKFNDRVEGRTFLITGTSPAGIGAETAYCLGKAHPRLLILAGRSPSRIQPVLDKLRAEGVNAEVLLLDLSSQKSIRAFVETVRQENIRIDVLINNAAIMACPYGLTEDGIETQFATNFLGPFLLTNLLLQADLIVERIVNVSSSASVRSPHYLLAPLDDLTYSHGQSYDPIQAYGVSKLALVLYTRALAAKVASRGITTFSLNPGSVISPLQQNVTEEMRQKAFKAALKEDPNFTPPVRKTLQQGCATQLRAGLDPHLRDQSGAYLDDCQVVELKQHQGSFHARGKLWTIGEHLVGESFDI
ncbi:uncharacterized protein HMPREF1541_10875 [Cyphellophora europaea CBS 101466]|uniref:Uncharacterized protein n=1 Tax=Cyphellophora europaea (strain CBS 101466) TaxID=1220924 RepID=W2S5X3_CYPE1|nr:uncharacterized protein HMPREF1541_10875 [Cyphellophora europaea CBS 101466]ETN44010.1 hypothetical protein HMPREF1541_10875 [Cyphellophora europaea CBS 101466]